MIEECNQDIHNARDLKWTMNIYSSSAHISIHMHTHAQHTHLCVSSGLYTHRKNAGSCYYRLTVELKSSI